MFVHAIPNADKALLMHVAIGDFQFSVGAPVLSGYGVPIELFAPFTDSCVIVMKRLISDVAKDVSWPRTEWNSLSLVWVFLVLHRRCVALQRLPRCIVCRAVPLHDATCLECWLCIFSSFCLNHFAWHRCLNLQPLECGRMPRMRLDCRVSIWLPCRPGISGVLEIASAFVTVIYCYPLS